MLTDHACESCPDCIHDGNKCCGCYDGSCCRPSQEQTMNEPARHPEDYCHRCDGPNISWFTPGAVWDPVMRPNADGAWMWEEIICPMCFVELARGGTWHLIPAKDDGERWTGADERAQIIAEAVVRERAAWATKVRAVIDPMGDPMDPKHLHPQAASLIFQLRGLLAADDTEGKP